MFTRIKFAPISRALILLFTLNLLACGGDGFRNGGGGSEDLVLTELSKSTAQPAVVSVSFKVQTRLGDPVANLSIDNFRIEENGDVISLFEATPSIAKDPDEFIYHTLLLMDLSGSVLSTSFDSLKEAASMFIATSLDESNPDSGNFYIKLAYFDGRENIVAMTTYTNDANALQAALDALNANDSMDSSTNLYGAVIQGVTDIQGTVTAATTEDVVSAGSLVVFTDGNDQAARRTLQQAQTAVDNASDAVTIFTIGLQGEMDENTLRRLGRDGSTLAEDIDELVVAFDEIALRINDEANSIYIFKYCSPKRSGETNQLKLTATRERQRGTLTTEFSAVGFGGGCVIQ